MVAPLTLENLQNGVDIARKNDPLPQEISIEEDKEKGELARFAIDNPGKIFEVKSSDEIDCDKYNYYYERETKPLGEYRAIYSVKLSKSDAIRYKNNNWIFYKVERKNRPMMERLKSKGFNLFGKKSADAPADAAPTNTTAAPSAMDKLKELKGRWFGDKSGGRRSRNQRKSRRSRKQRNERKSRKQRRSRR